MTLWRYTIKRLVQAAFVLWGVITITFALINAAPGDPVQIMLGPTMNPDAAQAIRAKYGLDQPVYIRYIKYLLATVQGDLGRSIQYSGAPVTGLIASAFPATILLVITSFTFAISTAIPLGVLSAKFRNHATDHVLRVFGLIGVSTPSFWIGLILIIVFAYHLGVLPPTGLVMPWAAPSQVEGAATRIDVLVMAGRHLILPTLSLGTLQMAAIMRIERSSMLEVLNKDYVRLARAYGVRERTVLRKHAFKNVQLPVLTVIGIQLTTALGGAVLTETVFNINGMGTLIIDGVRARDYPVILGATLFFAFIFVIGVLITDLLYAFIDPRVSYETEDTDGA